MRLYFSPGACSLSPHIVLREAGISFDLERVNLATKKTKSGEDFLQINPKGYVPALRLEDGEVLTEGPAIVQYVAGLNPASHLMPASETLGRVRVQEWLTFTNSELHKAFGPLFDARAQAEAKDAARQRISKRLAFAATSIDGKTFLVGDNFSVADAYLFTVLRWTTFGAIDLSQWPMLTAYVARIAARPSVIAAMAAEGIR